MHRYPEDTVATIEDLKSSGWKAAVTSAERPGYSAIWQSLSQAAGDALDGGKAAESKVLWLLADSCSMMLKPKSINEPFAPIAVFDGRRSALPEDFSGTDTSLLAEFAAELDDEWVRARIADLVWLCKKPRSVSHAVLAIDAYRAIPLDPKTWAHGARDCWERAIALSMQLRAGAGTRLQELESALLEKFECKDSPDGFFALSIAHLLFDSNLARERAHDIADALAKRGGSLVDSGAHHHARSYLEAAVQWYGRSGDKELHADMVCAVAEAWASEAVARANSDQPSNIVAVGFYEHAIHAFRSIPRALRAVRHVDERIAELHASLDAAGKASLGEMGVASSGSIDISEMVQTAQASVRGKPLLDALAALANVHHGARKKDIEEFSEKMLLEHPMQALFSATHLSRDGRVVAKRPGMGFGNRDSADYQLTLWAEMVKHYSMEVSLIVQGQIWPALQAFSLDHRIREADLARIVAQSPIVPHGRAPLIAKALFAGFERDLVVALHLLVPQVEHLVRWHLKSSGVKTSTLSADGVESENGLSKLVELPEVSKIFGDNIAFELNALFCDAFGPNLRNEVAHGLLDHESCQGAQTVYAWWLLLRMTFNTFWNAVQRKEHEPPEEPYLPAQTHAEQ
jgi:hypothetical protein